MTGTLLLIIVLLLAAMVLIIVEVCTPFFGLLGVAAVACVCWAGYLACTINGVFGLVMTVAGVVGLPVYIVGAVKILPKTGLGHRLHLGREKAPAGEGTPEAQDLSRLVGRKTTSETVLRPSGTIRIDGKRIVAQAESGMIEKGADVKIIHAAGNRVIVRAVET